MMTLHEYRLPVMVGHVAIGESSKESAKQDLWYIFWLNHLTSLFLGK